MTTVTIIVLVVCCVIVLGETSRGSTDQQLSFVVASHQQLDNKMNTCNAVVRRLQEDVKELQRDIKGLQAEFGCLNDTPCVSRTCKFMANGIS